MKLTHKLASDFTAPPTGGYAGKMGNRSSIRTDARRTDVQAVGSHARVMCRARDDTTQMSCAGIIRHAPTAPLVIVSHSATIFTYFVSRNTVPAAPRDAVYAIAQIVGVGAEPAHGRTRVS